MQSEVKCITKWEKNTHTLSTLHPINKWHESLCIDATVWGEDKTIWIRPYMKWPYLIPAADPDPDADADADEDDDAAADEDDDVSGLNFGRLC